MFWFIHKVAALMALIRGRSDSPDLERLAKLIHVALFSLARPGLGVNDHWSTANGFVLSRSFFPSEVWPLPWCPPCLFSNFW